MDWLVRNLLWILYVTVGYLAFFSVYVFIDWIRTKIRLQEKQLKKIDDAVWKLEAKAEKLEHSPALLRLHRLSIRVKPAFWTETAKMAECRPIHCCSTFLLGPGSDSTLAIALEVEIWRGGTARIGRKVWAGKFFCPDLRESWISDDDRDPDTFFFQFVDDEGSKVRFDLLDRCSKLQICGVRGRFGANTPDWDWATTPEPLQENVFLSVPINPATSSSERAASDNRFDEDSPFPMPEWEHETHGENGGLEWSIHTVDFAKKAELYGV
jgi:hypothetical protein